MKTPFLLCLAALTALAASTSCPAADLRLRLVSESPTWTVGHSCRFLVVVDNLQGAAGDNVICLLSIPSSLSFSAPRANASQGSHRVEGHQVRWTLGPLLPRQVETMEVILTPGTAGNFALQAGLDPTGDPNPQNNTAQLNVSIQPGPFVRPQPAQLGITHRPAEPLRLGHLSQSNILYRLDRTLDLGSGRWETMREYLGNGSWVESLVPPGNQPAFFRVVGKSSLPRLGSWGQYIKTNTVNWHDDPLRQKQALIDTGQNFCIYPIDEDLDWQDFIALLETVKGTDLRIFGAITAPHLGGGGANGLNRWFSHAYDEDVTDGNCFSNACPPATCDTKFSDYADYYACQQDFILQWLGAWKNAARCLSRLSLDYPNLAGYVINDFDGYVECVAEPSCLFGDKLTKDQVREIAEAAHCGNPDFQFWPTCYYNNFGRVIGKGYVLGVNYGVKLLTDDEIWIELSFDLDDSPFWAWLEFFHSDTVSDCGADSVIKEVFVNGLASGDKVWSERLIGNQAVQHFQENIVSRLKAGKKNTIYLRLESPTSEFNGCGKPFWRIWDVSLRCLKAGPGLALESFTIDSFTPTFHTKTYTVDYEYVVGCKSGDFPSETAGVPARIGNNDVRWGCDALPDDSALGYARRRLIAAPNDGYLIHDIVDGIVAPFYATRTFPDGLAIVCTSGPPLRAYRPYSYASGEFRALLESTKAQLGGAQLMALQLGMDLPDNPLTLANLEDQIEIAASVADYTGLWNMPLGLHDLDAGVFNDRRNNLGLASFTDTNHAGASVDWNFLAYWPGRQSGIPGWSVQWSSLPASSSKKFVVDVMDKIADTGDASSYKGLIQSVAVKTWFGTRTTYFQYDLAAIVPDAVRASWPMTITVPAFGSLELSMQQDLTRDPPNSSALAYFYVTDEAGAPVGADSGAWTFTTGVEAKVLETYKVETDVFLRLGK